MFAGAAFTDSADIKATEAVDTLTALGVIDGYTDGSFKPNGTVTRAEMAKMIFVLWNGGKYEPLAYQQHHLERRQVRRFGLSVYEQCIR